MFRTFTLVKLKSSLATARWLKVSFNQTHAGKYLEAIDYHKQMEQKDTVIIDVVINMSLISVIFNPQRMEPSYLPPVRNSNEFPWFNDPSVKKKKHNKTVMMYCTGGICCERATALEPNDGSRRRWWFQNERSSHGKR